MSNGQSLFHPDFYRQAERISHIAWAASVGDTLPASLARWCKTVGTASVALELLESDAWEAWASSLHGKLTEHLDRFHHRRYQDWRRISTRAKDQLTRHEPEIEARLAAAALSGQVPFDTVRWDIVSALICAGFADCDPPSDALRLLDIYEAARLPVGWDQESRRVLVY